MPWNESTQLMTVPININAGGDIQQATRCSSGNLGYCIVNGEITKWAKNKAFRLNQLSTPTDAQRSAALWGLYRPSEYQIDGTTMAVQKSSFISAATDGNAYEYLRPQGLANGSPFRFMDFDHYLRSSIQPIQDFAIGDINIAEVAGDHIDFDLMKNADQTYAISLSDIVSQLGLSNYYLAVGFVKGSSFYYHTAQYTLGDWAANSSQAVSQVRYSLTEQPFVGIGSGEAEVNYYICAASSRYYGSDSLPGEQTFIALPLGSASQGHGTITVSNNLTLTFTLGRIGNALPTTSISYQNYGTNASSYLGQTGSSYYDIGFSNTGGTLCFGFAIYNGGNTTMRFRLSSVQIQLSKNGVNWSTPATNPVSPRFWYATSASANLTQADSSNDINIASRSTVYVVMYCQSILTSGQSGNVSVGSARPELYMLYDGADRLTTPIYIGLQYNND